MEAQRINVSSNFLVPPLNRLSRNVMHLTKRHASPECRTPKKPMDVAKNLRRSCSVDGFERTAMASGPSSAAHTPGDTQKRIVEHTHIAAPQKGERTTTIPAAAPKKIPAYDYKARFQILSEKHKILIEKHDHLKEQFKDQKAADHSKIQSLNDELNAKIG